MSYGNRAFMIVAVFGLVSLSTLFGYMLGTGSSMPTPSGDDLVATAPNAERRSQADSDHAGVPRFAERFLSNPEPEDGSDREKRDLAAQENNAAWAFWLVFVSAIQAILSGLGIFFIIQSLKQGRLTVRAALGGMRQAARQARASEDALAHARELSEVQVRPYVYFLGADIPTPFSRDSEMTIRVKNFGATPAFDVRLALAEAFVRFPIGDFSITGDLSYGEGLPMLPPGDDTGLHLDCVLSEDEFDQVKAGSAAWVVRVCLAYRLSAGGAEEQHSLHIALTDECLSAGQLRMLGEATRSRRAGDATTK